MAAQSKMEPQDKKKWAFSSVWQFVDSREKYKIAMALAALVVSSLSNFAFPTIIGRTIDHSMWPDRSETLGTTGACVMGIVAVGAVASFFRIYFFKQATHQIEKNMRKRIYTSLMKKNISFYDDRSTGSLISVLLQDVENATSACTNNFAATLRSLSSTIGGTFMMLHLSCKLTLVTLAVVPLLGAGAMCYFKFVKNLRSVFQSRLDQAMGLAEEKISNYQTVCMFGKELDECASFGAVLDHLDTMASKTACASGVHMGGFFALLNACLLGVLYYGGMLVKKEELTIGELSSFAIYSGLVGAGVSGLSGLVGDFAKSSVSIKRINELINQEGNDILTIRKKIHNLEGVVEMKDVQFSYSSRSDVNVLKGLNMCAKPGEIMSLIGPSGAGKSTVASLLGCLYQPTSGKITIDGVDLSEVDEMWYRQTVIGFVGQEPVLFSGTIGENIAYGIGDGTASRDDIVKAAVLANAHNFIRELKLGYDTPVGLRGTQLSGGQKQRIAIARAVVRDPRVLIMDEPTSALDSENEKLVQEAMIRLKKNRTVIVISHQRSTMEIADKIIAIVDGKKVDEGSYNKLATTPLLNQLLEKRQIV
eukprot:GHVL01022752.1.p1 GENE.GHVL01022752.1~~GHVL01022752.1.p1  ORF type:complete len:591 (+),score=75.77 GHVL01022752.1:38-1810(+)